MGKKTLYRSVLRVVIVSENEIPIDEIQFNLSDAVKEFDDVGANVVGVMIDIDNAELVGKNAVIEIEKHGATPDVFNMDAQGFELEESEAFNDFIGDADMPQ
jgi:hypothetical protein